MRLLALLIFFLFFTALKGLSNESVYTDGSAGAHGLDYRFNLLSAELIKQFATQAAERAADRKETATRFDSVTEKLKDLLDVTHTHSEILTELLSSTHTPRSAAFVDACAQRSVLHITFPLINKTHPLFNGVNFGICSAFAYRPNPNKAISIITAAHCFAELVPGAEITLKYLGDSISRTCSILYNFSSPLDAAILSCTDITNVIGLVPSVGTRLSQVVAITGFTNDAYAGVTSHHLPGLAYALNVDYTRIVSIAGPPYTNPDGSVCVSSPDTIHWPVNPSGFVDRRVNAGLSGGPVLDLQCGVIGISHGRTCDAGVFMSLAPVNEYLATQEGDVRQ